jgi:hypothetical protein
VAARFSSWAAAQRNANPQSQSPDEAAREISYEAALRAHARFQAAVPPLSGLKSRPRASRDDGSLTRTDPSLSSSLEDVIQAQIQRLSNANPALDAKARPDDSAPDGSNETLNPFLTAFLTAQKAQEAEAPTPQTTKTAEEDIPLVFTEDHREDEFNFAQQLNQELERENHLNDVNLSALQEPETSIEAPLSPHIQSSRYTQPGDKMLALTVRLLPEDCEAVRLRANEAGLSISAYLRACALEVEQLRSQVKQMLDPLRKPAPEVTHRHTTDAQPGFFGLLVNRLSRMVPGSRTDL